MSEWVSLDIDCEARLDDCVGVGLGTGTRKVLFFCIRRKTNVHDKD